MKKIIAVLLSIMLTFGIATSAFAVADTTETTTTVETTTTEPDDPRLDEVETPSDAPEVEELPSTTHPSTTAPATPTDPEIPDAEKEPSILDRVYNAIMIFIKEMIQIIDDSCDKLIDFIDRHSN